MQDVDPLKRCSSPALSPKILHRKALVEKLNELLVGVQEVSHYKLILLCAPMGYGKTTLLADFALHSSLPCCWYFLDSSAVDKTVFLTFFILSIRQQFPDFGKMLDPLLASMIAEDVNPLSQAHQIDALIDALVATIESEIPERFALFLCNYYEVNISQGVNELVNELLQKLPAQCVIVIESRAVPALNFASLFARGEVEGIDHTLLRFTPEEIHDLASIQGVAPLQKKEAEQLATLFGGWIAGVLLGTRLGHVQILGAQRDIYTPSSQPEVQIDRQNLFAYLVNEVFSHDSNLYTFLKETSVLHKMIPTICNALLESTDAADYLHYAEQQGLFVTRSGEGTQIIYTCHPVLRELLLDELRRQSPERFVLLHQRAMEFWHSAQDYEQAIYHAQEAHLMDRAAHLIFETYEQFLAQGRMEMLARWLDALPKEIFSRYPRLYLLRATIYLPQGEYTQALALLTTASEAITQQPSLVDEDELLLVQATISIARSDALFQAGEYEQSRKLCQQVIEQVPVDDNALHAEAQTLLGVCDNVLGDYSAGIAHLQRALHLWGRDSERRQTAKLHNTLARTYALLGNFALAEHHIVRADKCWKHLRDGWGRVNNLLNRGMIKQRQGEYAAAEALFQEALTQARSSLHFRRGEAYALVNLGELYQEQRLYDQSLVAIEDGLALARQLQDKYLIGLTLCRMAMTYLLMGDAQTAMLLVSEAKPIGKYEEAHSQLTQGTILLYQHCYVEAGACFTELESRLHNVGLQVELLCTVLRLAECLMKQGHIPEALRRINEIASLILRNDYEQIVLRELQILPTLESAVRTMPELAFLHMILQSHIEDEQNEQEETPPIADVTPSPVVTISKSQLKIFALGEPMILINEQPVTRWRRPRAMELFFLLLDKGHPLRKEQIIAELWPESDDRIRQTLHSTIYYLRKSLGEASINSKTGIYYLDLKASFAENIWYDVKEFQKRELYTKKALASTDDATAKINLLAMVELYRGDYVQSFYSDWCMFQRDKLRLAYLNAHQQLALIAWRGEQFDESIVHWQHMLAIDNCLESAHGGLMRCYIRQGKRSLALRQYQRCVEVLQHELNAEPGPILQNLRQHLVKNS